MPSHPTVDEARVRELLAQGCTPKQIGLRLGISKAVVWAIKAGRRHVKGKTNARPG